MSISDLAKSIGIQDSSFPPVHLWNPEVCEGQNIYIDREGDWFYNKSIIKNKRILKLFSTVLKNENDNYFLVTPVEKVPVKVEIAPYVITDFNFDNDKNITFNTNFDYSFTLDKNHPIVSNLDSNALVIRVRENKINGFLNRNTYYRFLQFSMANGQIKNDSLYIESFEKEFRVGKIY